MNNEVMCGSDIIYMQITDFRYRGITLSSKMNPTYKRELIKIATIMPIEDDRDIPPEEITVEPREVILEATNRRLETKFREINNNVNNKGLIMQCNRSMINNLFARVIVNMQMRMEVTFD
jgi:hypothetical protein